jgi:hypothetical protein
MADPTVPLPHAFFRPHPLDNLVIADELESLDPVLDSKVLNILPNSDTPQIFTACGRGARSTLRTLRHGLEVEESVSSDLPGIPNAVWTTKLREDGKFYTQRITYLTDNMSQMHLILTSFFHSLTVPSSSPLAKQLRKSKTPVSYPLLLHSQSNKSAPMHFCRYIPTVSGMFSQIGGSMSGKFPRAKPSLVRQRTRDKLL